MSPGRPAHVRTSSEVLDDEQLVEELRSLLAEEDGFGELAARMALLADERRLRILFCLHAHPLIRSSDLARAIGAHESTTSHALALLREAGWVHAVRTGRVVRYELASGFAHDLLHELGSGHLDDVVHPHHHAHDGHHAHDEHPGHDGHHAHGGPSADEGSGRRPDA
ncbi:ArsR/SmtB family transcription factor [Brachybacterium paraconglomeratum]|uniref:ArsR/SmtB family transcription factor n=1 Tax=Brachybacterium paraconglomeratum TaxID=173362 RepID=UPI003F7C9407